MLTILMYLLAIPAILFGVAIAITLIVLLIKDLIDRGSKVEVNEEKLKGNLEMKVDKLNFIIEKFWKKILKK